MCIRDRPVLDRLAAPPRQLDLELPLPGVLVQPLADRVAQPSALPVVMEQPQVRGVVVDGAIAEPAAPVDTQGRERAARPAVVGEFGREGGEDLDRDEIAAVETGEEFGPCLDVGERHGARGHGGTGEGTYGGIHTVSLAGRQRAGTGDVRDRGARCSVVVACCPWCAYEVCGRGVHTAAVVARYAYDVPRPGKVPGRGNRHPRPSRPGHRRP